MYSSRMETCRFITTRANELSAASVGKKNWKMIDTINGVASSAIIYSIAETAKVNNLKPNDYFESMSLT